MSKEQKTQARLIINEHGGNTELIRAKIGILRNWVEAAASGVYGEKYTLKIL